VGYGGYRYSLLNQEKVSLEGRVSELQSSLAVSEANLAQAEKEKADLADRLAAKQEEVANLGEQVGEIADTVGTLEKLSKTDPELLQKYSKVYFLNEHYIPTKLTNIDEGYLYNKSSPQQIHTSVWPFLEDLLETARDDEVTLNIISAYRSFSTQSSIKSGYSFTYGAGTANKFIADQGYSEHQLGTTVDFGTPGVGATTVAFEKTTAYQWLLDNAYKYGFILSYPLGNAYYVFEPWHWRFVGEDLARDLHRAGTNFYSIDQRTINEHLVEIFD
jgi:D-alanyl-D-alanine carboxypeptidase